MEGKKMSKKRGVLKYVMILAMTAAAFMIMSGCGGRTYSIDEAKLAGRLLSEVEFDCELYQVQEKKVVNFIELEGAEKQIMYMGSGSFADSMGIFRLDSKKSAQAAMERVNSYLADIQDSFEDYIVQFHLLYKFALFQHFLVIAAPAHQVYH